MKGTKIIVGALVLSMGLLGTGYAYWTDELQVDTTVATGKFNVDFANQPTVSVYYADSLGTALANDNEYVKTGGTALLSDQQVDTLAATDNINDLITFDVTQLVPGVATIFETTIRNTGDVAAVLESISVTGTCAEELKEYLGVDIVAWDTTKGENVSILANGYVKMKDLPSNIVISGENQQNVLLLNQSPDDIITMKVKFYLMKDATNNTQLKDATVGFKLNFGQYFQPAQ